MSEAGRAQRLIVEHRYGPGAPERRVIEPGGSLRVGRTTRADLVIANDNKLSGVHFVLTWDGRRCLLREQGTTSGLELAGERVREGEVAHGDYISAGASVFMVYRERETPPALDAVMANPAHAAAALGALGAEREPLFAVLDAARGLRVRQLLLESIDQHQSLYDGTQGDALADVAPYLVCFARGSDLLARLVEEGWGKRWGIFLTSKRPFREVRTNLRRFLMVTNDATDERLYFRFYDPRTLRVFLRRARNRQSSAFFADIESFLAEGERGEPLRFARPSKEAMTESA